MKISLKTMVQIISFSALPQPDVVPCVALDRVPLGLPPPHPIMAAPSAAARSLAEGCVESGRENEDINSRSVGIKRQLFKINV